jgi:DNA-directed RNA polymerase specialized sigma24 family protein
MSHDTTPGLEAEPAERSDAESVTQTGAREPDPLLALVRAAASGQRDSLVRLLSLVAPPISATVRIFLARDPSEMEDVVQEVLIAVTESLPRFRGDSSFLPYCRGIAVRIALAHRRAHRQRAEIAISPCCGRRTNDRHGASRQHRLPSGKGDQRGHGAGRHHRDRRRVRQAELLLTDYFLAFVRPGRPPLLVHVVRQSEIAGSARSISSSNQ